MKINNLKVNFGVNKILDNVHLHVNCGEIIAVVGPTAQEKRRFCVPFLEKFRIKER